MMEGERRSKKAVRKEGERDGRVRKKGKRMEGRNKEGRKEEERKG